MEQQQGNTWKEQFNQDDASELTHFNLDNILIATNNFDTANKLEQGGFGTVYKVNDLSCSFCEPLLNFGSMQSPITSDQK